MEQVKKEALLTPSERRAANARVLKRHGIELPQTLAGYLEVPEFERLEIMAEQEQERLQDQVEKVLKYVEIRAKDQSLPEMICKDIQMPVVRQATALAQQEMVKAGFVKVEPKGGKK